MTDTDGLRVLYYTIRLICQTLVYGTYTILMPICSYVMLKRGLRGKMHILLFCMLIFMFSLSTAYWILSLYHDVHLITTSFVHGVSLDEAASTYILQEGMPLVNALVLLNYVLTDGVVVWRAWVLCQDGYSKSLIFPLMFLWLTLLSVLVTIGLRIAITVIRVRQHIVIAHRGISRALDYFQVADVVLSLLTNIFSTSIIGIKAWRHRRWITSELKLKRKNVTTAERILALLVESGIIYCLSGLVFLIATVIRLPDGTLGDVYAPVNVQFAVCSLILILAGQIDRLNQGIYPTIVLILVSRQGELNESVMFMDQDKSNSQRHVQDTSNLGTIEFGDNPHVNSSFGETETFAEMEAPEEEEIGTST